MNRSESTTEDIKNPEALESHEAPRSVEKSAEEIREQMLEQSGKEVADFKNEGAVELTQAETRAEKDGLHIDDNDKEELRGLGEEAIVAREELAAEIGGENNVEKKAATQDQIDALEKGKAKITRLQEAGKKDTSEYFDLYSHITEGFGENLKWRSAEEIDSEKISEMLAAIERSGMEMKERTIENPEMLDAKKASKKLMSEERLNLAREIREQRKLQTSRLAKLKSIVETGQEKISGESGDGQYGRIAEMQSREANLLAERIISENLTEQEMQEEKENISNSVDSSEGLKLIKKKLEEHYSKADAESRERFDTLNRSLEHVMKRNNVFLVHKFEEKEGDGFRHDENYSNVSVNTTYEDDLDIMLSFEPSISASSVIPGEKTKLWHGTSGFLLGGGQVGEAGSSDIRTIAHGIKDRRSEDGEIASIEEIDRIVNKKGSDYMNELVVNNPEVFGFFQHVEIDKNGRIGAADMKTRHYAEEVPGYGNQIDALKLGSIVDNYRKRFAVARERGIPLYIMTATREVYKYLGVNDDGTVEIGEQLTPEEVAVGRAGLSPEKRKEIGERLIEKKVFNKKESNDEAREIINNL